jgi:hypothetical protein
MAGRALRTRTPSLEAIRDDKPPEAVVITATPSVFG